MRSPDDRRARRPLPLLVAVIAGALVVGGCGDDEVAGNGTDRAFVAEMVPHHRGAVEMAEIAQQRGESPFVKALADDIVRSQTAEIAQLREQDAELADAGVRPGKLGGGDAMAMGEDTSSLRTAEPFDRAFLQMMLPHHTGALAMAETELAKGEDPELRELAREIIAAQEREIRAMRAAL